MNSRFPPQPGPIGLLDSGRVEYCSTLAWVFCTVISPISFAAQHVSGGTANDVFILGYVFRDGVGRLGCWLEGVPIPGPVQGIVVPAVTLDRYCRIPQITAPLHNVLQVSSLSSQVILNHLDYHGPHFVDIALQTTGRWCWEV